VNALQIASKIEIVPSALGETEFIGPTHAPRILNVNLFAGTIQVNANSGPALPGTFFWTIPHVPLTTLTPLIEQVAPLVQRALAGALKRPGDGAGWRIDFTAEAEAELEAADAIVMRFYRSWTGHNYAGLRYALCAGCGEEITHSLTVAQGRWVATDLDEDDGGYLQCPHGGTHEPHPGGHPHGPRLYFTGHGLDLEQNGAVWSGQCDCRTWASSGADWREIAETHFLHAGAPAPGAPLEIPKP